MISLDQVLLLERKVEEAVAKISQLQAENTELRNKCTELVSMVSSKSEQLSSFRQDQDRIENGILKALDRLNSIENSILNAAEQANQQQAEPLATEGAPLNQPQAPQMPQQQATEQVQTAQQPIMQGGEATAPQNQMPADSSQNPVQNVQGQENAEPQNPTAENGQFDIF